jgi:hypothetical protein
MLGKVLGFCSRLSISLTAYTASVLGTAILGL